MATMNLKTGLAAIIEQVEGLDGHAKFNMEMRTGCVIGCTIGWGPDFQDSDIPIGQIDAKVLKDAFGIEVDGTQYDYFSCFGKKHYTEEQWAVVRLFTTAIGWKIDKHLWLYEAKKQLSKMQ